MGAAPAPDCTGPPPRFTARAASAEMRRRRAHGARRAGRARGVRSAYSRLRCRRAGSFNHIECVDYVARPDSSIVGGASAGAPQGDYESLAGRSLGALVET